MTSLSLQFNQRVNYATWPSGDGFELVVQTTIDGANTWTTAWSQVITESIGPELRDVLINNEDVGSPNFQIAIGVVGNNSNLIGWFIDDIVLKETPPVDIQAKSIGISDHFLSDTIIPRATFYNASTVNADTRIVMGIAQNGVNVYTDTVSVLQCVAQETKEVSFKSWVPLDDVYEVNVECITQGDTYPNNNTVQKQVEAHAMTRYAYAYSKVPGETTGIYILNLDDAVDDFLFLTVEDLNAFMFAADADDSACIIGSEFSQCLWRINPADSTFNPLAIVGQIHSSLAYRPQDDKIYTLEVYYDKLFSFNRDGGSQTEIGVIPEHLKWQGMIADNSGDLYAIESTNNKLYKIDYQTAQIEEIGALGINLDGGSQDIAYDRVTDRILLTANILGAPALYEINKLTGEATHISNFSENRVYSAFAIPYGINSCPKYASIPMTQVLKGEDYSYPVVATDANGDELTYSLIDAPDWLTLNQAGVTPVLEGISTDIGVYNVILEVTDGMFIQQQAFTVEVISDNHIPVFTSIAPTQIEEESPYIYIVMAQDEDNDDVLTYSLSSSASFLTITQNPNNTALVFAMDPIAGEYEVTISVTDGEAVVEQNYILTVIGNNVAPVFVTEPVVEISEDYSYEYLIEATDENVNDQLSFTLDTEADFLSLSDNGNGTAVLTGQNVVVGTYEVKITVSDGELQTEQLWQLDVYVGLDEQVVQVKLYPNPVISHVNIYTTVNKGWFIIYNLQGQVEKRFCVNRGDFSTDLSDLQSGVYIVEFQSENVTVFRDLLIKQ